MENPEDKSPNDILRDELEESEKTGKAIADFGRKTTQVGQFAVDMARGIQDINIYLPEALNVEVLIPIFKNVNDINHHILTVFKDIDASIESSSGSLGTASGSVIQSSISAENVIPYLSPERQGPARYVVSNFLGIIDNPLFKEEVTDLLRFWGFDKAPKGQKSAFEQIITAFDAYEHPVSETNPIMTSLIPMRQCINIVISELLRRCSNQQKTKNYYNKVKFIGIQLKRDSIKDGVIEELSNQIGPLIDTLSNAKEANISRDEWRLRLNQATFFLNGLLHSLDMSKLRIE